MEIKKSFEGNEILKKGLLSDHPFIATKMGAVEQNLISVFMSHKNFSQVRAMASINAGITPPDDDTLMFFCEQYIEAIKNCDMMGMMGLNNEMNIIKTFNPNTICSELRYLEPFYFDSPWSQLLENKKVLVIHPFEKSIKNQYSKRQLLFSNEKTLPNFELTTIKAEQTNGGGKPNNFSFIESLNLMKEKINKVDFDIALVGCGAYGLLLANHIKNLGKKSVHIGGGLQILFGIKGRRWDVHPEISLLYNEHWVRPLDEEKTINYNSVEGGTYW